jgi:8-oxo-dGTP diphosphatase
VPRPHHPASSFPVVHWGGLTVSFDPCALPQGAQNVTAVVVLAHQDGRFVLADIPDRGWCVPSGRIEPGETPLEAAVRETHEEVGAELVGVRPLGHYVLVDEAGHSRYVPAYVGRVSSLADLPPGTESRGVSLATLEELPGCYWMWDALLEAVFHYAAASL